MIGRNVRGYIIRDEPLCGVSPPDVVVCFEGRQDIFPDGRFDASYLSRFTEIAPRQTDNVFNKREVHNRRKVLIVHIIHFACLTKPFFGRLNHICSVLVENLQKNLFRFRPVAIERDTYLSGNLDSANTLEVMNIIKTISRKKLVILVTHEEKLAQFYAYSDRKSVV